MKKIVLLAAFLLSTFAFSQSRGVRIGYIDMDYILEKVPEYAESKNQLDQKAQKWKQEIEVKKNAIKKLKDDLNTEKVLLTKELIEEREEEISFQEKELLEYQEKRFGPTGDLIIQQSTLVKPIQDQVFTAIQDIAEQKKYDFIFDKSSDLTMLFAAQRFDISDQVIRLLSRSQKREQLSKKQLKQQEAQEALEDMQDENPELAARQKALEEKRAAREKLIEERKAAREKLIEDRKKAAEAKRQKTTEAREGEKSGTVIEKENTEEQKTSTGEIEKTNPSPTEELTPEQKRAQLEEERNAKIEERKKALEEKRNEAIRKREEAKKQKETETKND
ncbi:OmpH family outer membrane protein [Flavobacterium chuncheonense]|uniref:OmpH family outer membrane protein n=1 Tax=Flavobacterium chuncheonense TaxID=2026653 RepID=A0ABW5YLA7_9FLAO